jgi:uncharacterized protein YggE
MNETKARVWFWILINIFIVALILFVLGGAFPWANQYANSLTPARQVTVSAQGTTTATPDLAEISFSVISQGANPQSLSDTNNTKMNAVMQFLTSQNIASSDIQTTGYDLSPDYQYFPATNRSTITGYTLTQTVTVKFHNDFAPVATVLGGLAPLGVNEIGGVTFTFNDQDDVVAPARIDAMNKAEAKAKVLASQVGASLGEVISVSENSVIPFPEPVYNAASGMGAMSVSAPVAPDIQPGSEQVTDNVTITYALR